MQRFLRFVNHDLALEAPAWHYLFAMNQLDESEDRDVMISQDEGATKILNDATQLAHDNVSALEDATLRLPHLLVAISKNQQFPLCRSFVEAGLDLQAAQSGFSAT